MASSFSSSPRHGLTTDFDENDSLDFDDDRGYTEQASDEDTEDASETDMVKQEQEFTGIKEQMYQDKLAQLKKQLGQLKEGNLPEYMKKLKKIEQTYKERLRMNEIWYACEMEIVEKDYIMEKKFAAREFEEKKIDMKESLIIELEEKKRQVDGERVTMELTGDSMEVKPVTTRKLRRRPNDPMPVPEKRRKQSPAQICCYLNDDEIMEDLRIINKVSGKPLKKPSLSTIQTTNNDGVFEARIDDGRLYFDKRWFHRGQPVFVESRETGKVSAVISAIGTQEIWLRKTSDNNKLRIYISQLQKGKYTIKRRST